MASCARTALAPASAAFASPRLAVPLRRTACQPGTLVRPERVVGRCLNTSASRRELSTARPAAAAAPVRTTNLPNARALPYSTATATATAPHPQIRMLLVGSPGSGKGTLSARLHEAYPSLSTVSAGDLLRRHIQEGTPLGKEAASVVSRGGLMPDERMMDMVRSEVDARGDADFLLDGFPRTQEQARLLDAALAGSKRPLNLIVNLAVPESVILKRILNRWVHPASGRVYNPSFNPPKVPGRDDVTGEKLVQRADDNEETFRARLVAFHRSTGPMIHHYSRTSHLLAPAGVAADAAENAASADAEKDPLAIASLEELSAALDATARRPISTDEKVYVSLKGSTSADIWPMLDAVVRWRYSLH